MLFSHLPLLSAMLCACALSASAFIRVDTTAKPVPQMVDEQGRQVLFHGVNVVYKIPPYYPTLASFTFDDSLAPADMQFLQDNGLNVVRLFVSWAGVEPAPGNFNLTYLQVLRDIVVNLSHYNIYTVLDAHQDLWSPHFCGEGAPDFATLRNGTKPFPLPVTKAPFPLDNATGLPPRAACNAHPFFYYTLSDAVGSAFQAFYEDQDGIQTRFAAFWNLVAAHFAALPSVLGYELLNEPWAGNIYKHPNQLVPKVADLVNLQPLYARLHQAIRAADDQHILFFEPTVAITSLPLVKFAETGLQQGPGGPAYNDRQMLAYHDYCVLLTPEGQPMDNATCRDTDGLLFQTRMADLARLGVGGMVTEWGALANGTGRDAAEAYHVCGNADAHLQSWIYWALKSYHDITTQASTREGVVLEGLWRPDGSLDEAKRRLLTRTYAQAVAGQTQRMLFDPPTARFTLVFAARPAISAPTVIFLNKPVFYPNGAHVAVTPDGSLTWQQGAQANTLLFSFAAGVAEGQQITIDIEAM